VGAGTGATTVALLPELPLDRTRYCFTDVSSFFLDRARQQFAQTPFMDYGLLDIDRSPTLQGYARHSVDVIVAVNVLHDAKNIDKTLEYLRGLLMPNGILLIVEGTHNSRTQMITVALLESFGRFQDRRQKTNLPLMSPEEWKICASDVGYSRFASFPEEGLSFEALPQHVMVAQAPAEIMQLDVDTFSLALAASLPDYMVPHHYIVLDELPLSSNGKIDAKALPSPWQHERSKLRKAGPANDIERRLAAIWREALNVTDFGVDEHFFDLGGDSLIAVRIVALIEHEFHFKGNVHENLLRHLFENPTVKVLAGHISSWLSPEHLENYESQIV
jgi:acyl carrier protein